MQMKPIFGKLQRQRREELGISLSELGRRVNASKSHIHNIERGKESIPSVYLAIRIANALQCDVQWLAAYEPVGEPIPFDL